MSLKKSLIQIKMIESGIVPALSGKDLMKMLESLSEDERRKVKRKFRKVWRKIAKKDKSLSYVMGLHNNDPTIFNKSARLTYVVSDISKNIME